jgi:EmrB/QacA subfamily drug resistance transporter
MNELVSSDANPLEKEATKKYALIIATLASFLTPFMGSSVNIALPAIGKEFSMNSVLLSWITTAYLLAVAILLVPFGRIADIYGRKKIFTVGMLIFLVSSCLTASSTSAQELIAFRILHGIGSAMLFSTSVAILISVYPSGERGRVLGINVASVYFGLSVGPFFGGLLTEYFGWRSIFLAVIPLVIVIIYLIFTKLKGDWAEAKGEKFDFAGAFIYCFSIVAIIYGFSLLPSVLGLGVVLGGIIGIAAFLQWEMKVDYPVLAIGMLRKNTVLTFSSLAAFINYSATFATGFILSLYLQYIKGLNPHYAGLVLISQPVVMALFSPFAGRLSDRFEPRIIASSGMGLITVGLFLFIFLGEKTPLGFIIAALVLSGLGFAFFSSPNTNAAMGSVEKRFFGIASGILATMRSTGMMFSMGITMVIFALHIGRVEIAPPNYPQFLKSVQVIFTVFTILSFGGIFASLARGCPATNQNH